MQIQCLGGAGTVSGSKHLVEGGGTRLLVDCGLFQGAKALRLRNWAPFPIDATSLEAVVLTHAHIDHTGWLPRLVRQGFDGPVYATPATCDLAAVLLRDSAYLQQEDAQYANRKGFSKHKPALPLYTTEDAEAAIALLRPLAFDTEQRIAGLTVRISPQGHILGAGSVLVGDGNRQILFSGDIGRQHDPLLPAPVPPGHHDCILMESTYGNRLHELGDPEVILGELVKRSAAQGGTLLIPSFAVGRAQSLVHWLGRAMESGAVPRLPIYVNSPMAISATEIYRRHAVDHCLSQDACEDLARLATYVSTVEESKELNRSRAPKVVIASSGMLTGGRILHHLKSFGADPHSIIMLPGFQAAGTRGAALADGATSVKVHGRYIPIRATVVQPRLFSAHADQAGLLAWLKAATGRPAQVHLVHGETEAAEELRCLIQDQLGWDVDVPELGATIAVR